MESILRVYCSARDNNLLRNHLERLPNVRLIPIEYAHSDVDQLLTKLLEHRIDVVVQIAPQWEWGKYIELISGRIIEAGIKLLCGEGAMFRWMGNGLYCGSDIGFYLTPWGYSGHSKSAYELPTPGREDFIIANIIRQEVPRWNPNTDDILIIGQIDTDRARYFGGSTESDFELIQKCIDLWDYKRLVYRPHPQSRTVLDRNIMQIVRIEQSGLPLKDILPCYFLSVSANSTATIEAMCAGIPTMNDGVGPWSGSTLVQRLGPHIVVFPYEDYLAPLASLVHMHYLEKWKFGRPFANALQFYSTPNLSIFKFECQRYDNDPLPWEGRYDY